MRPSIPTLLLVLLTMAAPPVAADEQLVAGATEVVAELPINPGNVAVTPEGRVFATVHQFRRAGVQLIEVTGPNGYRPWPNAAWNGPFGSGPDVLNSALGIQADRQGRLWVLDNGLGDPPQSPKLVAFSLTDGKPVWRYDFPPEVAPPGCFLNDLAVDDQRGFVYIADTGGSHEPALVILDLNNRSARRFSASPTLRAEAVDLVVEGRVMTRPDAEGQPQPVRVALNPITLSADGETLYFGAMTGKSWYQVPTRPLRTSADDATIAAAITRAGDKPVSDGAATDAAGNHYFTDLAHNAITVLRPDGRLERLVEDDERLLWPDALSLAASGWLYIAVNQLHRAPPLNGGVDVGRPPYRIMRVFSFAKDGQD